LAYPDSPSGMPCVENVLALMLDQVNRGRMSLNQLTARMSDAPARIWGMVGKGRIEVGYDADLILVDMQKTKTIHDADQLTKSGWSAWNGVTLRGWPVTTWVGGQRVYHEDSFDLSVRGTKPQFDHSRGGFANTTSGIGLA